MNSILSSFMRRLHAPIYDARIAELVRLILPFLKPGDQILDVGCGFGSLGHALLAHPSRPSSITVGGLERKKRGGELIPVDEYDGKRIPYQDGAFDIVILADVLHHEENMERLLSDSIRVAKRLLIVKDHKIDGPLAHARVSFLDWAANSPYSSACLYEYNSHAEWVALLGRQPVNVIQEHRSMRLYPPFVNLLFGRRLHYMAFCQKTNAARTADDPKRGGALIVGLVRPPSSVEG